MTEFLRQVWEPIAKLPRAQQIGLVAVVALVFAGVLLATMWGSTKEYIPLFEEQLKMEDAGKVAAKLKELNIDYKLGKDSTDIRVPLTEKSVILLQLAQEKTLPQARPGWQKLIDERSIFSGTTQQEFELNYIRGLQEEIESGLCKLGPIENAKVYIVKPKKEVFKEDQKDPSASVFLKFKPNVEINKEQIRAIREVISSAVEGLKPESIKITDTDARDLTRLLADDEEMSLDKVKSAQVKHTIDMEKRLEKKLQSQLEYVFGSGKAVVRVTAQLDFDQKEAISDVVIPPVDGATTGVELSTKVETEEYEGKDLVQDGEPGVNSNVPPGAPSYPGNEKGGTNTYKRGAKIANFDFTRSKEKFVKEQGKIRRLSVSVILDNTPERLGPGIEENIRTAAQATVGFDKKRGDVFTLMILPFNNDMADRARRDMDERARQEKNMFLIVVGLLMSIPVLLGIVYIIVRIIRARALARERAGQEQIKAEEEALRRAEELQRQTKREQQQQEWEQRFQDVNNFYTHVKDPEEKKRLVQAARLRAYRWAADNDDSPPDYDELPPEEQFLFREAFKRKSDGTLSDGVNRLETIMGVRERERQMELERLEAERMAEEQRAREEEMLREQEKKQEIEKIEKDRARRENLEDQVREMVANSPKDAVQVIRVWLEE